MHRRRKLNPLRKKRVDAGLTQRDMANFLNMTQAHYSRIESGDASATKHLNRIGSRLNCPVDEIFSYDQSEEENDDLLGEEFQTFSLQKHQKRPTEIYLEAKGWFTKQQLKILMQAIDKQFLADQFHEQDQA